MEGWRKGAGAWCGGREPGRGMEIILRKSYSP